LRPILFLAFLFIAIPAFSQADYFRAKQNGQEVQVICAEEPVFFEDKTPSTDPGYVVFYYLGPESYNPQTFDQNKLLSKGSDGRYSHTFTQPGRYIITQIVNRGEDIGTVPEPQEYEVVARPAPTFSVQVCASGSVQVTIDDVGYDNYELNYGDNTPPLSGLRPGEQARYTYRSGGTYTLTVTGRYTGAACTNIPVTQTVTLLPPPPTPVIAQLEVLREAADGEILFALEGLQPGYRYVLERRTTATGNFEAIYTSTPLTQTNWPDFRIGNVDTRQPIQFRIRPTDDCGTQLAIFSAPVSSLVLGVQTGNELADLNWSGIGGNVQQYQVYRNGNQVAALNGTTTTYSDRNLSCGQNYCYQIRNTLNNGQSRSLSAPRCIVATSTVTPPAAYLYSTYTPENQIELRLNVPDGQMAQQVRYQRSIEGAPFADLPATAQDTYTDPLQPLSPVCYRASYTNPCERTSPFSNTTCPVFLIALPQENAPIITLGWTGYVGFPDGVSQYTVELLDANNRVVSSIPVMGNTYIDRNLSEELQELRYRVRVTSGNGSATSYSNIVIIQQPLQVYIPTAFTPNGDGLNDVLEVKGRFIASFGIKVYNNMGQVVFSSDTQQNSWDGTHQGRPMPAGAYAYELQATAPNGQTQRRTGTVTLLR
jgi:gliding motility-associated-like protein